MCALVTGVQTCALPIFCRMAVFTFLLTRPHGRGRAPGAKTRRRALRWQAASGPCKNPRRARWRSGGRAKIVSWGSGQALAAAVIPLVDRAPGEGADGAAAAGPDGPAAAEIGRASCTERAGHYA